MGACWPNELISEQSHYAHLISFSLRLCALAPLRSIFTASLRPRRRGTRRTFAEVHLVVVIMLLWNSRTVRRCAQRAWAYLDSFLEFAHHPHTNFLYLRLTGEGAALISAWVVLWWVAAVARQPVRLFHNGMPRSRKGGIFMRLVSRGEKERNAAAGFAKSRANRFDLQAGVRLRPPFDALRPP